MMNMHLNFTCYYGYLDLAKWLIELGSQNDFSLVNIHADREFAFKESCHNGHYNVAKWLIDLSKQPGYTPFSNDLIAKYYNPQG